MTDGNNESNRGLQVNLMNMRWNLETDAIFTSVELLVYTIIFVPVIWKLGNIMQGIMKYSLYAFEAIFTLRVLICIILYIFDLYKAKKADKTSNQSDNDAVEFFKEFTGKMSIFIVDLSLRYLVLLISFTILFAFKRAEFILNTAL